MNLKSSLESSLLTSLATYIGGEGMRGGTSSSLPMCIEKEDKIHPCYFPFTTSLFSLSLVIETLKDVDPTRKCFRLVGGVLVERTVKEVLPALESNKEQVTFLF